MKMSYPCHRTSFRNKMDNKVTPERKFIRKDYYKWYHYHGQGCPGIPAMGDCPCCNGHAEIRAAQADFTHARAGEFNSRRAQRKHVILKRFFRKRALRQSEHEEMMS